MVDDFCFCAPLEKGCICIAVIGLATSGVIFVVQENLWTLLSLGLSIISGGFLLSGTIKYARMSIIFYIIIEIIHVTEMFTACVVIFTDLIVFRNFKCRWNRHCYWFTLSYWESSNEIDGSDDNNVEDCDKVGIILGSLFSVYILVDFYFLKCGYSLLMKTHISKSNSIPA